MKKTVLAGVSLVLSLPAFAQSVRSPIDCFLASDTALSRLGATEGQRARVCAGAVSDASLQCFMAARGSFSSQFALDNDQIAALCAGATTAELPLRCMMATRSITRSANLGVDDFVRLCGGTSSETAPAGCFRATERMDLAVEDRVALCRAAR